MGDNGCMTKGDLETAELLRESLSFQEEIAVEIRRKDGALPASSKAQGLQHKHVPRERRASRCRIHLSVILGIIC